MKPTPLQIFLARAMPFFMLGLMVVLFVLGFLVFSYILIFAAVVGLIVFIVATIRDKLFRRKKTTLTNHKPQGRIIDQD